MPLTATNNLIQKFRLVSGLGRYSDKYEIRISKSETEPNAQTSKSFKSKSIQFDFVLEFLFLQFDIV
jgi:hypothetical protein